MGSPDINLSSADGGPGAPPARPPRQRVRAVVLDVGGVLLDWNPRYLYRSLLPDEEAVERFLAEVCTTAWNRAQDAGRPWSEAVAERCARFPGQAALIRAYHERWPEMVAGPLPGAPELLAELRGRGVPTYLLTNFSADKWDLAVRRWPFLTDADGAVVSGRERVTKPDPAIYRLLLDRYGLDPAATFFTDDLAANVDAARGAGLVAERFLDSDRLRARLGALGVLPERAGTRGAG